MEKRVTNEGEYLIVRAHAETDIARGMLDRARADDDYFREKAAAKLVAYHEQEEKLVKLYVEMKLHYPMLAEALDKQKPYLAVMWEEAKAQWAKIQNEL